MEAGVDLFIVLTLLTATIVMFAINRPRMDAVALIMMTILPLTGVITASEALAGLSDPNIVLIGALFVIGEGLVRTGVAQRLGDLLVRRAGKNEARLIMLLMVIVAGIGSVMSSTGAVAIFIPSVLRIARNAQIAPGRLMMPLSTAALISGMMTLIATPPNLILHSQLIRAGYDGFRFFEFAIIGVPILIVTIVYMLATRRWLASDDTDSKRVVSSRPRLSEWIRQYELAGRAYRLRILPNSPWIGKQLNELRLRSNYDVNVLAIGRARRFANSTVEPSAQTVLQEGDILFVVKEAQSKSEEPQIPGESTELQEEPREDVADELSRKFHLARLPMPEDGFADESHVVGMAELMIPATSELIDKTAITARFRSRYKLSIIGIKRGGVPMETEIKDEAFRLGDTLLVAGPWRAIKRLRSDPNELVVLNVPADVDDVIEAPSRAPFAIGILGLVVIMMVTGVVANVQAALIGCLLLGLFRCINMNAAYRSIQWPTLFLIVGMLPFSVALQNSGGVDLATNALLRLVGEANPTVMLVALYVVTVILGLFISNTATAVLMAPIAVALGVEMGMPPHAFAMTVALASSAAFITPVSSPVNALVVGPGNYRFIDFVRIGAPLALLVMIVSIMLIRLLFTVGVSI